MIEAVDTPVEEGPGTFAAGVVVDTGAVARTAEFVAMAVARVAVELGPVAELPAAVEDSRMAAVPAEDNILRPAVGWAGRKTVGAWLEDLALGLDSE